MKRSLAILLFFLCGCAQRDGEVIVYTSQDQIYAEALFAEFTKETGIKVLPVFDSESVKTAGLAQRLLAEMKNPRADIFWSNEEMISHYLGERGALDSNAWRKAGFRTRRLVVNTNLVSLQDAPKTLHDLTNAKWAGKIAMAYPVYGTTAAHMVALRQEWGDDKWRKWCEALVANKPLVVDGNSVVVRLVGSGEAAIGLTDWDDIAAGKRNSLPIEMIAFTPEFLLIPSTVSIVVGAPHSREAKRFFEFVQSDQAIKLLVEKGALEGARPMCAGVELTMPADFEGTRDLLKEIFARK